VISVICAVTCPPVQEADCLAASQSCTNQAPLLSLYQYTYTSLSELASFYSPQIVSVNIKNTRAEDP
jgi:hypothetical protein